MPDAPIIRIEKDNSGALVANTWKHIEGDASYEAAAGPQLIPLAKWTQLRRHLAPNDLSQLGVWLDGHDDILALEPDLGRLILIAIRFPAFKDGRGYSAAYLLRQRLGYQGHLRAIGDILRDQLFYLKRVGFDEFQLREGEDVIAAVGGLNDFSNVYQASVDQPLPLYQRRHVSNNAGATELSETA